jgi:hypothetical protein
MEERLASRVASPNTTLRELYRLIGTEIPYNCETLIPNYTLFLFGYLIAIFQLRKICIE